MSLPRRLELLRWASTSGAWLLEDDYDSEYRYAHRPLAALQGLDSDARVIYAGTFSKVFFPALRLGYLVVPPALIDTFAKVRLFTDVCPPTFTQAVLADFIAEGHFERHIRRMPLPYRERQEAPLEAAHRYLDGLLDVLRSDGGMHLLGWLPPGSATKPHLSAPRSKASRPYRFRFSATDLYGAARYSLDTRHSHQSRSPTARRA